MIKQKGTLMVAALLLGTTMGAMAEPRADEVRIEQEVVRFDDLDLTNRAGVATLHFRLRMAASNVCGQGGPGLTAHQQQRKCRDQAVERALASVPAAVVAYHAEWKADGANWLAMPPKSSPTQLASVR